MIRRMSNFYFKVYIKNILFLLMFLGVLFYSVEFLHYIVTHFI